MEDLGTLAQLVQSAALTEQRSLVRAQYVPLSDLLLLTEIFVNNLKRSGNVIKPAAHSA